METERERTGLKCKEGRWIGAPLRTERDDVVKF